MDIERTDDPWFDDYGYDAFLDDEDPYGYGELEDLRAIPSLRRPEDMPPVRSQADLPALARPHGRAGVRAVAAVPPVLRHRRQLHTSDPRHHRDPRPARRRHGRRADALLRPDSRGGHGAGYARGHPVRAAGGPLPRAADLAWARFITEAARRHGVPIHPVHVANDEELTVVTPDELVEPA